MLLKCYFNSLVHIIHSYHLVIIHKYYIINVGTDVFNS